MKYIIYQIASIADCPYAFMEWDFAVDHQFNFNDYKKVYTGKLIGEENAPVGILEKLFKKFNMDRPKDFKGHSLSVSDIVEIVDDEMISSYWYCDSFGWRNISASLSSK